MYTELGVLEKYSFKLRQLQTPPPWIVYGGLARPRDGNQFLPRCGFWSLRRRANPLLCWTSFVIANDGLHTALRWSLCVCVCVCCEVACGKEWELYKYVVRHGRNVGGVCRVWTTVLRWESSRRRFWCEFHVVFHSAQLYANQAIVEWDDVFETNAGLCVFIPLTNPVHVSGAEEHAKVSSTAKGLIHAMCLSDSKLEGGYYHPDIVV